MLSVSDRVKSLEEERKVLHGRQEDLMCNIKDHDTKLFIEMGGCQTCQGRGWIVTWDTLDCMQGGYAQYASCNVDSCTQETRSTSGMSPRRSKYDRNRGTIVEPVGSPDQIFELQSIRNKILDIGAKISEIYETWSPDVNKIVKITSGGRGPISRRPKVGVEGLVIKKFTNNWGTEKLIVLDSDGYKHWPSAKQVVVIDPDPDTSVFDEHIEDQRRKDGLPVVVTVKARSAKAALVVTTTSKETWVPFSQTPELSNTKKGDTLSIIIPMWIIKKKNLI